MTTRAGNSRAESLHLLPNRLPVRDFERVRRRARSPRSRTYLAESRGSARLATAKRAPAAARSLSEVKVRRVGTGCARIHFFGLALDFFLSSRPARLAASVPMYAPPTDLAYMAGTARYPPLVHAHAHARVHLSFLSACPSHSLARPPCTRQPCTHTCIRERARLPS